MKKNKVVLAGLAGLALVAAIAPAALAADADVTTPQTKSTPVTYKVDAGYEWSVPKEVVFNINKGETTSAFIFDDDTSLKVTKNVISNGTSLHITIVGDGDHGAFQIKNGSATLNYEVSTVRTGETSFTSVSPRDEILAVPAGTNAESQKLRFKLTLTDENAPTVAGMYSGNAVFTAQVK